MSSTEVHPLKHLLQLNLASDSSTVNHLPNTLTTLGPNCFLPSTHLTKWTTRVNSLLRSKDAGARWAGLILAAKTSILSRPTMIECAQGWVGVALPMLSKSEPLPVIKAAIRLLTILFSAGTGIPEFQRQLSIPNLPKFSQSLLNLVEKHNNAELKVLVFDTLARLIPLYPTTHRASHSNINTACLKCLDGSTPDPTTDAVLKAASRLYASLHFIGGKTGAATVWKKSVDETLQFGWTALLSIRKSFNDNFEVASSVKFHKTDLEDPLLSVPLNIDRLRCATRVLSDLLRSTTTRSVQVPISRLIKFATALVSCNYDDAKIGHVELNTQSLEISAVPSIHRFGCEFLNALSKCIQQHLGPHLAQLLFILKYQLEQKNPLINRLHFLRATEAVLAHSHPQHSPVVSTQLVRAVLPTLSMALSVRPPEQSSSSMITGSGKSSKGKKRANGYDGEELFKTTRDVICPSNLDGEVLLAAVDALSLLLRNPSLTPAMHSIASRLVLTLLLTLPRMTPESLCANPKIHSEFLTKVKVLAIDHSFSDSVLLSKNLSLILGSTSSEIGSRATSRELELLIHPRVPPLFRSFQVPQAVSLFRAEESREEEKIRQALGLENSRNTEGADQAAMIQDVPETSRGTEKLRSMVEESHSLQTEPTQPSHPAGNTSSLELEHTLPPSITSRPANLASMTGTSSFRDVVPNQQRPSAAGGDTKPWFRAQPVANTSTPQLGTMVSNVPNKSDELSMEEEEGIPEINMESDTDSEV